jgi:hypothetical protein
VTLHGSSTPQLEALVPVRNILRSPTNSDHTIRWVKDEMKQCMETHNSCRSPKGDPPGRLLKVQKQQLGITVKLVDGLEAKDVSYLCLSHCWGEKHMACITTRKNLGAHKQGIKWSALPRIFQQAIEFTLALDYQYVWIDSLCIVQNDDNEWKVEAAKMSGIYGRGDLTLAATCSEGNGGSMFYNPNILQRGIELDDLEQFGFSGRVFARIASDHDPGTSPLQRRAWAYQERLLSPRFLHFLDTEVVWECNALSACQCGLEMPLAPIGGAAAWNQGTGKNSKAEHWSKLRNQQVDTTNRWDMIVEEYSRANLTKHRDKLPAIAGVAKQLMEHGEMSAYRAGLWNHDLYRGLLWHAMPESAKKPRPEVWAGPTWSWASIKGQVTYRPLIAGYNLAFPNLSCHYISCKPTGEDETMNLESAYLELRAYAFSAVFQGRTHLPTRETKEYIGDGSDEYVLDSSAVVDSGLGLDRPIQSNPRLKRFSACLYRLAKFLRRLVLQPQSNSCSSGSSPTRSLVPLPVDSLVFFPDYQLDAPGPHRVRLGEEIFCLNIGEMERNRDMALHKIAPPYVYLMILRKAIDGSSYERIGLARCEDDDAAKKLAQGKRMLFGIL